MHHKRGLGRELQAEGLSQVQADALVSQLSKDYRQAGDLSQQDQRLLEYAEKLTLHPHEIQLVDVENLRATGLADRAIHDACGVVAYFAFVNRIADGLGVTLEHHDGAT